ncbi:MAG: sensor histidine kinase [Microcystaceae cyanobacterium]
MSEIDRLKAELEQTRLAYQMAAQISQFKTGFLGRTAHELRSPLSSLMGLYQLILSDLCESPEEEREFIKQASQVTQKLLKIIDEIILVSKLEYGKIPLEKEPVNLTNILSDVFPLVHLQAAHNNLRLNLEEIGEDIYILGDQKRLLLGLTNLVDTAISWMMQGEINLQATREGELGIIQIRLDCNRSIWQETKDLLEQSPTFSPENFQEFAQTLEMSAGEKYLLAFNLIEAMGGKLTLLEMNSTPDVTLLQISFPLVDS